MNNPTPFEILPISWRWTSCAVYVGQGVCLCLIVWVVLKWLKSGMTKPVFDFTGSIFLLGLTAFLFGVIDFLSVLIFGIRPVLCTQVDPVGQDIGIAIMGALFPVYTGALLLVTVFITGLILYVVQRPK